MSFQPILVRRWLIWLIFASLIWISLVVAVLDCINFGGLELSGGQGVTDPDGGRAKSRFLKIGFLLILVLVVLIP